MSNKKYLNRPMVPKNLANSFDFLVDHATHDILEDDFIHLFRDHHKVQTLDIQQAQKLGVQKALIVRNINGLRAKREDYHSHFPYIEKEKLYHLIDELEQEGLIEITNPFEDVKLLPLEIKKPNRS